MALIKCINCGAMISDRASTCPKCGCPMQDGITEFMLGKAESKKAAGCLDEAYSIIRQMEQRGITNSDVINMKLEIEEEFAATRRNERLKIVAILGVIIVVVIITGAWIYSYASKKQKDKAAWEQLTAHPSIELIDKYMEDFPKGEFIENARQMKDAILSEIDKWNKLCLSSDYRDYLAYAKRNENGIFSKMAIERADSVLYNNTKQKNTVEAYEFYLTTFPQGRYTDQATDAIGQIHALEVSEDEMSSVTRVISRFFYAMGSKDTDGITNCVAPIMSSFLKKQNATKADVIYYMNKMYANDVLGLSYNVNDGVKISKFNADNNSYGYDASFSVDLRINREDTSKPTFISYTVTMKINDSMEITFMSMNKISEY